ncbi:MAG: alginate lyase family protein [Ignavibacteriales bacterium]|nr:alginate lyase family protein [Ignavibacteriales bacterium]
MNVRFGFPIVVFTWFVVSLVSLCSAQTGVPRVFLLDPPTLVKVRAACVADDALVRPALKRLVKDADKLLDENPVSVMEKPQFPPSGDKHDYMSLARYYWSDPKKPDGLPYISRDGETNPEINTVPDHANLARMVSAVHTLAVAYCLTGTELYAQHAAKFIRTWFLDTATRMNPNLNFAQGVKGLDAGRPSGLIDSRGLAQVVDGIGLLAGSKEWTAEDQNRMVEWFSQYLEWLLTSKNGVGESMAANNHGVFYDVQAGTIAAFVGKTDVARRIVEEAKEKRIGKQIEPDGSQPRELARTTSQGYVRFNLEAFFLLANLGANLGFDLWNYRTEDGRSIRKALDWVLPFIRGDKEWTHKQIKRFDIVEYYPLLLQASARFNDPTYTELAWKLRGAEGASDRIHLLIGK